MEWIKEFYTRQEQLSGVFSEPIHESDRERALILVNLAGPAPRRVLELGAGGGQTAAATADLGYEVTAIELVEGAVKHAQELARETRQGSLEVLQANFYDIEPAGQFDVISYWDGFGVGSDDDQQALLKLITGWLAPGGSVLLDVYTPWYWSNVVGRTSDFGQSLRRYGFDAENCRLLDTWWPKGEEDQAVTQSLRCYSPADLRLLLHDSGLALHTLQPGGMVDYQQGQYIKAVPLGQAMQYLAVLKHNS